MYPPIFATCYADSSVTDLLGSSPCRLYLFGQAPQGVTLPYAVWQQLGGSPENYLDKVPDIDLLSIQVDVYAASAASAREVAEVLRDAIEPVAHIVNWIGDDRDPNTKNYRFTFQVDWWVDRSTSST